MNGIRLGRVAGVDVHVDWSLLIVFLLIAFGLAGGLFPAWHPNWGPGLTWTVALSAAVLFFISVFLHELSHALMGRVQGVEINRITLFIFGGVAQLEREPGAWRAELWMAIVGPLTSLVIGAFCLMLFGLVAGPLEMDPARPEETFAQFSPLATLLIWLGQINVILALFNLVPGFPLDGGRVLRAILWAVTGNLHRATRWASLAGQAFAWLLIVAGISMLFGARVPLLGAGPVNGIWLMFIGWFLNNAAVFSYRQLIVREALEEVPVAKLMRRNFITVSPDLTVADFVDEYLLRSDQRAFPVVEDGRLLGLICLQDVRNWSRPTWSRLHLRDIMTPAAALTQMEPEEDAAEALFILSRSGVNQVPVVENGRIQGILYRENLLRWLSLYGDRVASGPPRLGSTA